MTKRTFKNRLKADASSCAFIEHEALPGTGLGPEALWRGFDELVYDHV